MDQLLGDDVFVAQALAGDLRAAVAAGRGHEVSVGDGFDRSPRAARQLLGQRLAGGVLQLLAAQVGFGGGQHQGGAGGRGCQDALVVPDQGVAVQALGDDVAG